MTSNLSQAMTDDTGIALPTRTTTTTSLADFKLCIRVTGYGIPAVLLAIVSPSRYAAYASQQARYTGNAYFKSSRSSALSTTTS